MLSCKEATELASNSFDTHIPLAKRLGMKMHLLICRHCRNYLKQLRFIHGAVSHHGEALADSRHNGEALSPEAKERIKQALEQRH